MIIPYNASDPYQQAFLRGINASEGSPGYQQGFGYAPLSGYSTNPYGFPDWPGSAQYNTHAAGAYQFEPATWNGIAGQYGLNFQNPADQDAAAWYNAQQSYTGGSGNLYADLQNGTFNPTTLSGQWSSLSNPSAFNTAYQSSLSSGGGGDMGGGMGTQYSAPQPGTDPGVSPDTLFGPDTGAADPMGTEAPLLTDPLAAAPGGVSAAGASPDYGYPTWTGPQEPGAGGLFSNPFDPSLSQFPTPTNPTSGAQTGAELAASGVASAASGGILSGLGNALGMQQIATAITNSASGFFGSLENWFTRGALIALGIGIIVVAFWHLAEPNVSVSDAAKMAVAAA